MKTVMNIYLDPMYEHYIEGQAELLELIKSDTMFRYYRVKFLIDGIVGIRKIKNSNFLNLGE